MYNDQVCVSDTETLFCHFHALYPLLTQPSEPIYHSLNVQIEDYTLRELVFLSYPFNPNIWYLNSIECYNVLYKIIPSQMSYGYFPDPTCSFHSHTPYQTNRQKQKKQKQQQNKKKKKIKK